MNRFQCGLSITNFDGTIYFIRCCCRCRCCYVIFVVAYCMCRVCLRVLCAVHICLIQSALASIIVWVPFFISLKFLIEHNYTHISLPKCSSIIIFSFVFFHENAKNVWIIRCVHRFQAIYHHYQHSFLWFECCAVRCGQFFIKSVKKKKKSMGSTTIMRTKDSWTLCKNFEKKN